MSKAQTGSSASLGALVEQEPSPTFRIAIFTSESPQEPTVYKYSPTAESDDALYYNLDTLPKEAIKAINVLHEANTLAIT